MVCLTWTTKPRDDLMVPRTQIVALPNTATIREAIEVFRESKHSRFPVYEGTIDTIVGTLFIKELLESIDLRGGSGITAASDHARSCGPPTSCRSPSRSACCWRDSKRIVSRWRLSPTSLVAPRGW